MFTSRPLSSARVLARAAGLAACLFVAAPAAAQADPENFCVANQVAYPCPTTGFDHTSTNFAGLKSYIANNGAEDGAHIRVEPGTYTDYDLDGPSDLDVFGDPAYSTKYPILTSSTATPAVTVTQLSEGSTFTHLEIDHTGSTPGTALLATNQFELHDVYLDSNGAALVHSGSHGADILDDVIASSIPNTPAPGPSAAAIPLIQTNTSSTQTWTQLGVYAPDRASGIVAKDAGITNIDGLYSDAHGLVNGKGGYALAFIGFDPGGEDTRNPNVIIHQAELHGGSFGLAGFSTQLHGYDVLATSDGAPPQQVKVGSDDPVDDGGGALVDDPMPPAAVASAAASNFSLLNFTAVAAGAGADGIVANSPVGTDDGNGFDYAAFATVQNSIIRGPHADVEVTNAASPNFQQGHISTDHDNFVTSIGATDNITGGPTVTLDATDQVDDPMFVNPVVGPNADFHVSAGSKTLQAAGFIPDGDFDLEGHARPGPAGTAGDLGAYESTAAPSGPGTPPAQFIVTTGGGGAGAGGGGGGGGQAAAPPAVKSVPAPPAPSNVFSVDKPAVGKTGTITLTLHAPGPGTFAITATTPPAKSSGKSKSKSKPKPVSFASATATAGGTKAVTATLKPSGTAASSLKKGKKLSVTITVTFTPTGGTAATKTTTVSVKRKK